jgi:mitogen-activated protein kinase organizer 1
MQYTGHKIEKFTIDLSFNIRDSHIISGAEDGKIYIYDILKKEPIKSIQAHEKVLSTLDFHEFGGMVSASHDGSVSYWKI